jgi:hypothetical protein
LIEQYLEDAGMPPVDFKMWCFGKRVEFVSTHHDRFGNYRIGAFDRECAPYNINFGVEQWSGVIRQPPNYDEMIAVAEALADGSAFVRVDLYSVGNKVYFGELTPYPGGVSATYLPRSTDVRLGQLWVDR